MTVLTIIEGVRPLVSDADNPYRWNDAQIIVRINDGIQHISSVRPDALLEASVGPPDDVEAKYDAIPLRSTFRMALTYYVASMLLQERSSDKSLRIQGSDYLKLFNSLIGV